MEWDYGTEILTFGVLYEREGPGNRCWGRVVKATSSEDARAKAEMLIAREWPDRVCHITDVWLMESLDELDLLRVASGR